jgi:multidrug efflux pump subunit AcrA (membrane-fusion protein)
MKWKRGLTYVVACLLGAGILTWVAMTVHKPAGEEEGADVEPLVAVKVANAEQHTVTTEVRLEGRVEALPDRESRISAPLEGQLTRVAVHEGQNVQAGQVLMELYNADLAGTVQAAHGSLTAAQAAAERAEKTVLLRDVEERTVVSKAEAALSEAQAKLSLLRAGPRSQEVAQASATLEQELAKLHALETGTRPEQIAVARHQAEAERAALDRLHNGPIPQEIEAAEAALQAEQADLDRLNAGARPQEREQAKARVASAKSALETAEAEAKRKAKLCDEGIVSVAEKQSAASAAAAARAEYVAASQDLSMVQQGPRA